MAHSHTSNRRAWFKFFQDDYLGGTQAFACAEHGAYLLLLLAQWASTDKQAVMDNETVLLKILGEPLCGSVRQKFQVITIDGQNHLRNLRLAAEWAETNHLHNERSRAAHKRWRDAKHNANDHTTSMQPAIQSDMQNDDTRARSQNPRSKNKKVQKIRAVAAPQSSLKVITRIAHEVLAQGTENGDRSEAIKSLCALRHITYDSAVIRKALDSAEAQRAAKRR